MKLFWLVRLSVIFSYVCDVYLMILCLLLTEREEEDLHCIVVYSL